MITIKCRDIIQIDLKKQTVSLHLDEVETHRIYQILGERIGEKEPVDAGEIRFEHPSTVVHVDGRFHLPPTLFRLFRSLYESSEKTLNESALRETIWKGYPVDIDSMAQAAYRLQRKLRAENTGYTLKYSTALNTFVARLEKIK